MSIQASINSIIGSAASAAFMGAHLRAQSPAYKKMLEVKNIKDQLAIKQQKAQGIAEDIMLKHKDDPLKTLTTEYDEDIAELGKQDVDLKKQLFEADPTQKNYEEYRDSLKTYRSMQKSFSKAQGDNANTRMKEELDSAMRIKDTMKRMRGLYNE